MTISTLRLSALVFVAATSLSAALIVPAAAGGAYGPDTCKDGFVWRDAFPDDHVCVTPGERTKARKQNAKANLRRSPTGGAYGPDTCRQGYVWRDGEEGDHVCVTPAERSEAALQNELAPERYAD